MSFPAIGIHTLIDNDSELPVPINFFWYFSFKFTTNTMIVQSLLGCYFNCNATTLLMNAWSVLQVQTKRRPLLANSADPLKTRNVKFRFFCYISKFSATHLFCSFRNHHHMKLMKIPTLVFLLRAASASPYSALKHKTGRPGIERGSPEFWYHLIVGVFLVLAGGFFAGCVYCQKNKVGEKRF